MLSKMYPRELVVVISILFSLCPFALHAEHEEIWDPLEPVNRKVFWFNDKVDTYALEPVAKAYDWAMPKPGQRGVRNFFRNLVYPRYLVTDILRLEFKRAGIDSLRFVINSTIGLLGFIDVAEDWGFTYRDNDFALVMADYGISAGPYLVLPFLGPSTLRETGGLVGDALTHPLYWYSTSDISDSNTRSILSYSLLALDIINTRARLIEAIKSGKESSLDFYAFSQASYYQYRSGLLKGEQANMYKDASTSSDDWDKD